MRLVKPISMFTSSLIGYDSVFLPYRRRQSVEVDSLTQRDPQLWGDMWWWWCTVAQRCLGRFNCNILDRTFISARKARQSGNSDPCCDEEHSLTTHKANTPKAGSSSFCAQRHVNKWPLVEMINRVLFRAQRDSQKFSSCTGLTNDLSAPSALLSLSQWRCAVRPGVRARRAESLYIIFSLS